MIIPKPIERSKRFPYDHKPEEQRGLISAIEGLCTIIFQKATLLLGNKLFAFFTKITCWFIRFGGKSTLA